MTDDERAARAIVQRWLDTTERGGDAYPSYSAMRDLAVLFALNRQPRQPSPPQVQP